MGDLEVTELGVADLSFDIQRSAYNWDFIMYELKVNDLILGIYWLSTQKVFLASENKQVVHKKCNYEIKILFQG